MNAPYMGKFRVSQKYRGNSHDGFDLVGIDSKEIHCVVKGKVIKAGWENSSNHKQGFGQYVKIETADKDVWYYGHLSKISVVVGQVVNVTDIIGVEGNTGYSTGSHLHICVRKNGVYGAHKDVSQILGIPNKIGIYCDGYTITPTVKVAPVISIVTPATAVGNIDVTYQCYSNKRWQSPVVNYNDTNGNGYAGVEKFGIQGIAAKTSVGTLKYRVHIKGCGWLAWVTGYNINDDNNGYAGIIGKFIDGIQFDFSGADGYKVKYRVSTVSSKGYLGWVTGFNTTNDNGYAGIFGQAIDKLQITISK